MYNLISFGFVQSLLCNAMQMQKDSLKLLYILARQKF